MSALTPLGPWMLIVIGGVFETFWALGFKQIRSDAPLWQWAGLVALIVISMGLLYLGMRDLPAGTAYAVWTGIGAIGVAIAGIVFFAEPATATRLLCLGLIVAGIVGLRLTAS